MRLQVRFVILNGFFFVSFAFLSLFSRWKILKTVHALNWTMMGNSDGDKQQQQQRQQEKENKKYFFYTSPTAFTKMKMDLKQWEKIKLYSTITTTKSTVTPSTTFYSLKTIKNGKLLCTCLLFFYSVCMNLNLNSNNIYLHYFLSQFSFCSSSSSIWMEKYRCVRIVFIADDWDCCTSTEYQWCSMSFRWETKRKWISIRFVSLSSEMKEK